MKKATKMILIIFGGIIVLAILLITILKIRGVNISINKVNINNIDQIAEYKYDTTINCEAFDNEIKYFNYYSNLNRGWLVTENDDVYLFNLYELYSNNTNCKKIDDKFDEISFVVRDIDGGFKYFNSNMQEIYINISDYNGTVEASDVYDRDNFVYGVYDSTNTDVRKTILTVLEENGYIKTQLAPGPLGIKGDNKIYGFYLSNIGGNANFLDEFIIRNQTVEFRADYGEKIIDFYFTPNVDYYYYGRSDSHYNEEKLNNYMFDNFVLTDKGYYRYLLVDEDCEKYIDIECEYKLMKDEELTKFKDYILYRDELVLITKNGRVYWYSYLGY